ncbi:hypothetical protein [Nonomuraea dietziae]|uniref:hypothetical protein n=1 Tax=Nonomuraea dietziae TaxID=65515 RepID=UPI0033F14375
MLQRFRAAAVALAVGAGALALAPTATAATAPSISQVDVSPSPIVVTGDQQVTATFTFTTKGAGKAELKLTAPGDVGVGTPVDLTPAPHGQETRWTAKKTFDAKNAGKWNFLAIAHSGDGSDKSTDGSFTVEVKKSAVDTKIVDFGAHPDVVAKGDRISVSGRLLAERDGWKGYGDQRVTITFREKGTDAYRHITTVGTSRSGWFSARVSVEATGWWRAEFNGHAGAKGSVSDTDRVDVRHRSADSRIVGFSADPEPVDKGDRLNFRGALQVDGSHGWDGLAGQRVTILFKAHGSSRWEAVTGDRTGRDGRFWASATAQTSGWWRAVFSGSRGVEGSSSSSDWVRVVKPTPPPSRDKSKLVKFNAYPEPVKYGNYLRFRGVLLVDGGGYEAKVGLYFKPKGSSKWQFVKTTNSTGSGKLYTKVKAYKSGYWKFVFKGDDDAYGSQSGRDYVRVKR